MAPSAPESQILDADAVSALYIEDVIGWIGPNKFRAVLTHDEHIPAQKCRTRQAILPLGHIQPQPWTFLRAALILAIALPRRSTFRLCVSVHRLTGGRKRGGIVRDAITLGAKVLDI